MIFELVADTGWETHIDIDKWLKKYCVNRYGACPQKMYDVWMFLKEDRFKRQKWGSNATWQNGAPGNAHKFSDAFNEHVKTFLSMRGEFKNSPFYQDDALEMASFVLSQKADEFLDAANKALDAGDMAAYKKNKDQGLKFLLQADRLLESHSLNRLERWTAFAKAHATDQKLREYYEENAKRIVTSWGPPVNDYSARVWSGLIRDFYVPRIEAYFNSKITGVRFRGRERNKWEEKWIRTPGISKITPYKDPLDAAYKIVTFAAAAKPEQLAMLQGGPTVGEWTPGTISKRWATLEWPIETDQIAKLKGIKFTYTKGKHRLDIKSVELVCDGNSVAKDVHGGMAGTKGERNIYRLNVPKNVEANNGAVIRAVVKGNRGTDSYGKVEILTDPKKK